MYFLLLGKACQEGGLKKQDAFHQIPSEEEKPRVQTELQGAQCLRLPKARRIARDRMPRERYYVGLFRGFGRLVPLPANKSGDQFDLLP